MAVKITSVEPGSPARRARIHKGDTLISINGNPITDVLDYQFYTTDEHLEILLCDEEKKVRTVLVEKDGYDDLGLQFETYLMDKQMGCRNACIFCFVDQMPPGMRKSLYFKDDDTRMSFLFGNYTTLTNLKEGDIRRIIKMHISPINISVHTMNPELRVQMMKTPSPARRSILSGCSPRAASGSTPRLCSVPATTTGRSWSTVCRSLPSSARTCRASRWCRWG